MDEQLTVVCVSYKRYKEIHIPINSFLCQTLSNWKMLIIHDGPDEKMRGSVEGYTKDNPNIEYMETEERFDDWGHSLSEIGIHRADTEFILLTNDDNYYVPKFLECMFEPIEKADADFVLRNMVHSHQNPKILHSGRVQLFRFVSEEVLHRRRKFHRENQHGKGSGFSGQRLHR